MPAQTDQITSVLQRTFNGLEQKKEGLIRGGNSASAKSFNVLDKKLQATAAKSNSSRIQFDEPTQYSSGSGLRQQLNNGGKSAPKVIVLNPQYLPKTSENQADRKSSTNNGTSSQNEASKVALPKPKVCKKSTIKIFDTKDETDIISHVFLGYFLPNVSGRCGLLKDQSSRSWYG